MPTLPNQYVVIASAVLSNRIVIYWQLKIVSHNYRHITDAPVGTNVVYVVSSLLIAVAFLCFPTYYVVSIHTAGPDVCIDICGMCKRPKK